jgi:EAL domain-containing protein (putative c-di-GMP-specific phosphodiesterase class I)
MPELPHWPSCGVYARVKAWGLGPLTVGFGRLLGPDPNRSPFETEVRQMHGDHRSPSSGTDAAQDPIRTQAGEIIDSVLADQPSGAVTDRLRALVAAYPGQPERALLEHLMETRQLTGSGTTAPGALAAGVAAQDLDEPEIEQFSAQDSRERILPLLGERMLLAAFQPVVDLSTGTVIGVDALARFVSDEGDSPESWFGEAASVGLGTDLEIAALVAALEAAAEMPTYLHLALNVSAAACLDLRFAAAVARCGLATGRIVLELTQLPDGPQTAAVITALRQLRQGGLRLAVDYPGREPAAAAAVAELAPDIIQVRRSHIAELGTEAGQRFLSDSIDFASSIGAIVGVKGIETPAELEAVGLAGAAWGQGYYLGRPTVHPRDWARWLLTADH